MKSFENTAVKIASLGRQDVIRQIRNFNGRFKLDFSEDYLKDVSVDRLRHILMAAVITRSKSR